MFISQWNSPTMYTHTYMHMFPSQFEGAGPVLNEEGSSSRSKEPPWQVVTGTRQWLGVVDVVEAPFSVRRLTKPASTGALCTTCIYIRCQTRGGKQTK